MGCENGVRRQAAGPVGHLRQQVQPIGVYYQRRQVGGRAIGLEEHFHEFGRISQPGTNEQ